MSVTPSNDVSPKQFIVHRHWLRWRVPGANDELSSGHVELVPGPDPLLPVTLREVTIPAGATLTYVQTDQEDL